MLTSEESKNLLRDVKRRLINAHDEIMGTADYRDLEPRVYSLNRADARTSRFVNNEAPRYLRHLGTLPERAPHEVRAVIADGAVFNGCHVAFGTDAAVFLANATDSEEHCGMAVFTSATGTTLVMYPLYCAELFERMRRVGFTVTVTTPPRKRRKRR
jgi:hypothetical protein